MEIKGSAVKTIPEFIRKFHADKYESWLNELPEASKKIFSGTVLSSAWYNLNDAAVIPTETFGKLIFNDPEKGAWECGRYSAEVALTGIYKFFVKAASPFFIIERAGKIFSTYYSPSVMKLADKGEEYVVLHITQFDEPSVLVEQRICGWIERAMEINGVGQVDVITKQSLAKGDPITEIAVKWGKELEN